MKKYTYLLIEHDIDGRTNEATKILVAILGGDTKEEIERITLRTIAKHMAEGDYTRIAALEEGITTNNRTNIHKFLVADEDGFTMEQNSWIFTLKRIDVDEWPRKDSKDMRRYMLPIFENEKTGENCYVKEVDKDTACQTYLVDISDIYAIVSPFIYASPFIVKGKDLYAVDTQTGEKYGPYSAADWESMFYSVKRDGKAGLVSLYGKPITDCIYDNALSLNGIAILRKDGKDGVYVPWLDVLTPCEYDSIEYMPEERAYIIATKDGVQGFISTDCSFHPETDEDPDDSFEYL